MGGEVRMSLTGEVMDVHQPTPRGTGPGGYGPPPGAGPGPKRPGGPMPAGPPRARGAGIAYEEPKKTGPPVALIVFLVLVLVGGGAGGWWWYNNRTNPKDQALILYKSILKQDWRGVVGIIAWPSSHTQADEDAFVKGAGDSYARTKAMMPPEVSQAVENMDVSVGEPTVTGNTAEVPTTGKMNMLGREVVLKGTAHMIRQGGIWKLDFTQVRPNDNAAIQRVVADLVGKPDVSATGAGPGMGGGAGGGMGGSPGGGGGRRGRR